jgi:hypothetical protein
VNDCVTITGNGTWAVGGNATNIRNDSVNYVAGSSSVEFDITAGALGYLENSTMISTDLSTLLNMGTLFAYVYLPTASQFTNIILRFGSSSTAYYQVTATTTQSGTTFQNGWNLIAFPWLGATVIGVPDPTKIKYLRVIYTTVNAQTGCRLNQVFASLGSILEIEYYSKFLFRDASTGAFQETVTNDSNLINLDTESHNLLLFKICEFAVQQQQGLDAMFYDGNYFGGLYNQSLAQYQQMYPSEAMKTTAKYYNVRKPSWRPARRGW